MTSAENGQPSVQSETVGGIEGIEYIELYTGNSRQAAYFFRTACGFTPVAYAGQETGCRDRMSFVLAQGEIRLLVTAPLDQHSALAQHVYRHGDGVRDIALRVADASTAFERAVKRGARPVQEPVVREDQHGRVVQATIAAFGDTVHTFVQRDASTGAFLPGYRPLDASPCPPALALLAVDHLGISVEAGTLGEWVDFYRQVLGFELIHEEEVVTAQSAMRSCVVQDPSGVVKFPLQEPVPGRRQSQIEEYLAAYGGPGVQHLALLTADILSCVRFLREQGIEFLSTPETYYHLLGDRVGAIEENIDALRRQHILVDRDEWGYLLQIFSKPIQSRPTFFLEFIQRKDARGFGSGNIRALFEAVERDQALRGSL